MTFKWLGTTLRRSRGSALMVVMIFVAVMGLSMASLASLGTHQRSQATRMRLFQEELTAAEQAADAMIGQIRFLARSRPRQIREAPGEGFEQFTNAVESIAPPQIHGFEMDPQVTGIEAVAGQNQGWQTIDDPGDPWFGFAQMRQDFRVRSFAKSASVLSERLEHPGVGLERAVRIINTPLYAYAIFYGNTLELDAGARLDVVGRVHTNGNFFLTTSSSAYYHKQVTVAGNFFGGFYDPTTGRTGSKTDVYVTVNGTSDPSNTGSMGRVYGRADNASKWLTSRDVTGYSANPNYNPNIPESIFNPRVNYNGTDYNNWVAESSTRFNGFLRDRSHGISPLNLPIPSTDDPHVLIERPNANDPVAVEEIKFANKADVYITGNPSNLASIQAVNRAGNPIPLTYTAPDGSTQSIVSISTIYNGREQKYVDMINLDMGKLAASGIDLGDGIVYITPDQPTGASASTRQAGVRITNASTLPTNVQGALTVATDAPLYAQGNINTNRDAIVMLAGDSINLLSNNWKDTNSPNSTEANKPKAATPTTTNAIFLTGNVPSAKNIGKYSGGAENFFRYLENWSGIQHTFNGSLLNLFESRIAVGPWDQNAAANVQSSPYYSAPRRVWSWDPNLAGVTPPPGMPVVMDIMLLEWKLKSREELAS